ncbi:MAG TPA: hypothetical protein VI548_00050 [Chitinophagaceae bacterium]|nr:hypothetical protein [Chitinophagaceae bacterium]
MKQFLYKSIFLKKFLALSTLFFIQSFIWAQEKLDVNISVDDKSNNWYAQPWVWVAAGAVFIIIIVGLLRGRGSKE